MSMMLKKVRNLQIRKAIEKTSGTCSYYSTSLGEYDAKEKIPVSKATPVEIGKSTKKTTGICSYHLTCFGE